MAFELLIDIAFSPADSGRHRHDAEGEGGGARWRLQRRRNCFENARKLYWSEFQRLARARRASRRRPIGGCRHRDLSYLLLGLKLSCQDAEHNRFLELRSFSQILCRLSCPKSCWMPAVKQQARDDVAVERIVN